MPHINSNFSVCFCHDTFSFDTFLLVFYDSFNFVLLNINSSSWLFGIWVFLLFGIFIGSFCEVTFLAHYIGSLLDNVLEIYSEYLLALSLMFYFRTFL